MRPVRKHSVRSRFGLALIVPLQAKLNFLLTVPTVIVIYLALSKWTPSIGGSFWLAPYAGIDNFVTVFTETQRFVVSLARTALFVGIAVPLEFSIGLGLALLLQPKMRFKSTITSLLLTPMLILPAVVGIIFTLVLSDQGPVSYFFGRLGWFADRNMAFLAVIVADAWQWSPFMFLILYTGLMALPQEVLTAARVAGASRWQMLRYVTLPMMRKVVLAAFIIRSLEAFKIFDVPFIMTRGGPGTATETVSIYIYQMSFSNLQFSLGAAAGLVLLILVALVAYFSTRKVLEY